MSLIVETVERIRAVMLARLTGSPGLTQTDTSPGSPWWLLCNAVAYEVRKVVVGILSNLLQCVPATSTGTWLDRWADTFLDGGRLRATKATGAVMLYADVGYTTAVPINSEIVAADGTSYQTTAAVASGDWAGGTVTVLFESLTLGTVANKAVGTALALTSPPVGVQATCYVVSGLDDAEDDETDAELQVRLTTETRYRPGSGKAADYVQWIREAQVDYVTNACVYPRWDAADPNTIVYVVPLGPVGSHLPSAISAAAAFANVTDNFPIGASPVLAHAAGAGAAQLVLSLVQLQMDVRPRPGYEADWVCPAVPLAVAAGSVNPRVQLDASPVGVIVTGDRIVLPHAAGAVVQRTECEVSGVGANWVEITTWPGAPSVGEDVYPGGPLYQPVADAVAEVFDRLGTWPSSDPDKPRFPPHETELPGWLYLSDVVSELESVDGVESCAVTVLSVGGAPPGDAHADLTDEVDPAVTDQPAIYVGALDHIVTWL